MEQMIFIFRLNQMLTREIRCQAERSEASPTRYERLCGRDGTERHSLRV